MKTIKCKFKDFDFERFLEEYNSKVRTIFEINDNEPLNSIIEVINYSKMEVDFNFSDKSDKKIIENFENEKISLFFPVGLMADNRGIYLRLINLIQYRVADGDVDRMYGDIKNYSVKEEILDIGNSKLNIDSTLGLIVRKKENKLYINIAQYELGSCMSAPSLKIQEDTGEIASELKDYLAQYNK